MSMKSESVSGTVPLTLEKSVVEDGKKCYSIYNCRLLQRGGCLFAKMRKDMMPPRVL